MVNSNTGRDEDVETQIMLLESAVGDGPHQRERERAAVWLLAHADRSYPRILALLKERGARPNTIALLPSFDRKESIPPLAQLLSGSPSTAWIVGQALARHSDPTAGAVLRDAVVGSNADAAVAAADGLGTRADRGDCAALAQAIATPDARVRYHVLQAAGRLGCFERDVLEHMAHADADADVRSLARRLVGER